jgi:LTXXQ motif family protein
VKRNSLLIFFGTLVMTAVQCVHAQQGPPPVHTPLAMASAPGQLIATDEVLGDSMVLPLLGMSDHIEGRLAFLRTELKIAPMQLALWNAFAAAARANAAQENAMRQEQSSAIDNDSTTPSLPQRLEAHERDLRAHLQMLQTISTALLPLYASFSVEQKNLAEGFANGAAGL